MAGGSGFTPSMFMPQPSFGGFGKGPGLSLNSLFAGSGGAQQPAPAPQPAAPAPANVQPAPFAATPRVSMPAATNVQFDPNSGRFFDMQSGQMYFDPYGQLPIGTAIIGGGGNPYAQLF